MVVEVVVEEAAAVAVEEADIAPEEEVEAALVKARTFRLGMSLLLHCFTIL